MNIYLVRHGEKIPKKGDPGLSETGKKQAQNLGRHFKNINIDQFVSSPTKRSIETSDFISIEITKPYSVDARLKERLNFGDVKSQTYSEFLNELEKSTKNRNYILQNGVSSISKGKMVEELIREKNETNDDIILVFHSSAIIDFLRNVVEGVEEKYLHNNLNSNNIIKCGAYVMLKYDKNGYKILKFNVEP